MRFAEGEAQEGSKGQVDYFHRETDPPEDWPQKGARGAKTNQADGRLARLIETRRLEEFCSVSAAAFFAPFVLFCG